jgi:PKD repeat protein
MALVCAVAVNARAAEGSQYSSIGQYGQAARFGGFDTDAYDNETYDGVLTSGLFLNPVGFAVDTQDTTPGGDGTAIYVLDRVSDYAAYAGGSGTEWRLQKLSDKGVVLGSTEFYLPTSGTSALGVNDPTGVEGLAIDDAGGRIYTLLYGTTGSGNAATPYAEEIIGWSTAPVSGKLVAPGSSGSYPALPEETALTKEVSGYSRPGLLSSASQLATTELYDPQGLALDATGGQDDLAIEADGARRASSGSPQGPAIVEQVSTAAATSGAESAGWSAASLSGVQNGGTDTKAVAAGISTDSDGSLDVLLNPTIGGSVLDAVDLQSDLTSPDVLASSAIDPSNGDAVPLTVAGASGNHPTAGPQAIQLSNGLYAADFYEDTAGAAYWEKAVNEGIRLLAPASGGLLANPFSAVPSVFDTLGDSTSGQPCYIGDAGSGQGANGVALAAGANGAVWVLTAGRDSSDYGGSGSDAAFVSGRQVLELTPGAAGTCAGPSKTFSVANAAPGSTAQEASTSSPLTVTEGATVDFDAASIDYPTSAAATQAPVYAYEWDPTGASSGGPDNDGFTLFDDTVEVGAFRPATTASYQYTTPGIYTANLKLLGDFGEYDESGTIVVQTTNPPTAAFNAPATAQTGQTVSFDASGSQPASGAQIADYHWSYGDGQTDDTQSPTDTHVYASPGAYTVTLTVRDNDEQASAPVTQQITVTSPPSSGGGGGGTTGTTTTVTATTTSTGTTTGTVAADRSATNVSPTATWSTKSAVLVTVTCPATKVSCAGTIQLKTASAVASRVAQASKHTKKVKKSVLTLGQASFSLAGGKRETLTIALSTAGKKLLKKSKRLKAIVLVSAHDSFGDPGSSTLTLTLTTPPKKK